MDPFEPIRVDPDNTGPTDRPQKLPGQPALPGEGQPRPGMDALDAAIAAAPMAYFVAASGAPAQMEATISGAAEVAAESGHDVLVPMDDPLFDPSVPDVDPGPADSAGGCALGAFALLITLTLAAGTALAVAR